MQRLETLIQGLDVSIRELDMPQILDSFFQESIDSISEMIWIAERDHIGRQKDRECFVVHLMIDEEYGASIL